jgi:prolyl-tRNA synthetase
LVVPPRVAPVALAILPVFKNEAEKTQVMTFVDQILEKLVGQAEMVSAAKRQRRDIESYFFDKVTHQQIVVDTRDTRPGDKNYHWEQRGVPLRIEVGPRDVAAGAALLKRRLDRAKENVALDALSPQWLQNKLDEIHAMMFEKARNFREQNMRDAHSYDELKTLVEQGGFVRCYFAPDRDAEAKIKAETKATVRCIPLQQSAGEGKCVYSGKPTSTQVLFAQAY